MHRKCAACEATDGETEAVARSERARVARRGADTFDRKELPGAPMPSGIEVGRPSDPLERQADRMADRVMRMNPPAAAGVGRTLGAAPGTAVLRQAEEQVGEIDAVEENPVLHLKAAPGGPPGAAAVSGRASALGLATGGGASLSPALRSYFEPRFGQRFDAVRVHTGEAAAATAASLNARAFTYGRHIAFAPGEFSPSTAGGMRLIAHELAHVVQQGAPGADAQPDRVHRMTRGAGASPRGNYVEVPEDERGRVDAAIAIVRRVATDHPNYPGCQRFFRDNCPGGTMDTLENTFNSAVVWKRHPNPEGWLGSTHDATHHIAYTRVAYDVSQWAIAATLVHELMHSCGQASHDVGDDAKAACGRLPNI